MSANFDIEKLLTIDDTGMPKPPNVRQIQDKDVMLLYTRDHTSDKRQYIAEAGVIYYLGDPKSPAKQQGLSEAESLQMAIENYNLPKDYVPDMVVRKLIEKYYYSNITEAGVAIEALQKSVHLISLAATKINELLNKKLTNAIGDEDIPPILALMDSVSRKVSEIPSLTKALHTAYENLRSEEEEAHARGGSKVLSSMKADEE